MAYVISLIRDKYDELISMINYLAQIIIYVHIITFRSIYIVDINPLLRNVANY